MNNYIENQDGILIKDYFDDILWDIKPVYVKTDPPKLSNGETLDVYGEVVQLQWGFTPGLTKRQLEFVSKHDQEVGFQCTTIDIYMAIELYKDLGHLLRKNGLIHNSRQLLTENEQLKDIIAQLINNNPNPTAEFQAIADSTNYVGID